MSWLYLIIAGIMEWGWPVGLKFAWDGQHFRWVPAGGALVSMILSGYFLFLAIRMIPMGTAYAVWTGIGAVGAFIIGILYFDEPTSLLRFASIALIVGGIVGLKVSS